MSEAHPQPGTSVDLPERVAHLLKSMAQCATPAEMASFAHHAKDVRPHDPASAFVHAATLYLSGGLAEAEQALRALVQALPRYGAARYYLGLVLLAQGKYAEGWRQYDARAAVEQIAARFPQNFAFPRWQGENIAGKRVVIFPEQGFGDQIQFVRFVPELVARGAQVTLLTSPKLVRLFAHNFPRVDVVAASGNVSFPDPDYWLTLSDLPARLGVTLEWLKRRPYLVAPELQSPPSGTSGIGLMVQGNAGYGMDRFRSLPAEFAEQLRRELPQPLIDLAPESTGAGDFADTAAIIGGLDLVVSVDTAVGHLAGAMGKKCLLLIPGFGTDWRWMRDRTDTPWYSQHLLYRGDGDGNWQGAVAAVIRDANKLTLPVFGLMRDAARLRQEGRFSEALAVGRRAMAADPHHPGALHNVGRLLTDLGRLREAEPLQRKAVSLAPHHPDFAFGLGLNLLAQGRYDEAWDHYEARTRVADLDTGAPRSLPFPRWQGEDISGKSITIFPEQGIGDQLQFARFLPWLRSRCASLTLLAPPTLVDLLRTGFPAVTIAAAMPNTSYSRSDVWTTLVDLPRLARTTLESLPAGDYLRVHFPARPADGAFRIGVMTQGNPKHAMDQFRSLPASSAQRLRDQLPGELVELAPEVSGACSFLDTARIMAGLDLIVSVDTSVAHLAGALGKPCLMLLNGFGTDWRWLRDRADTPWYSNHRLYRSGIHGEWDGAVDAVIAEARRIALPVPSA